MRRVALIHRSVPSSWVSCRSITRGLISAYRQVIAENRLKSFAFELEFTGYEALRIAEEMLAFSPDVISFVDHAPHPAALVLALADVYEREARALPKLVFHVFGDFLLRPDDWQRLEPVFRQSDIHFVCASQKHRSLLEKLMKGDDRLLSWMPFPVEFSPDGFDPALRERVRRSAGLGPEDFVFLYSGRMSLQKNVTLLIKSFLPYASRFNETAHLWLAGPIDDLGRPYLGINPPDGLFSYDLRALLDEGRARGVEGRLRYLGNLDEARLREANHAADAYVSFSTHNDEDFGMSPAEAAMCGCPLILSDWGGFSSFRELLGADIVSSIPVRIRPRSVTPELDDCVRALAAASARSPLAAEARTEIAARAKEKLSVAAVADALRGLLESERRVRFSSFTPLFEQVERAFREKPRAPFRSGMNFSKLYRQVYGATYV